MIKRISYILLAATTLFACSDDDSLAPTSGLVETDADADGLSAPSERFCWVKSADVSTRSSFLRSFGVGYSYDAVNGRYCCWEDIRCQILNRSILENERSAQLLYHDYGIDVTSISSKFSYSQHDYVAAVEVNTKKETNLGIYNAEMRTRHYVLEDGIKESFYYTHDESRIIATLAVDAANIIAMSQTKYDKNGYLTKSFIDAVLHLSDQPVESMASVDSFINVYGTHVITAASLGGRLRVDLKNDMFRYNDKVRDTEWTTEELFGARESSSEQRQTEEYQWLETSRLNLSAWGGDQSTLTSLLGEHKYDGTRTFSLDGISKWRQSIFYDPDNELASNVELIDMQVVPIWEFVAIIDDDVANLVKGAVLRDVSYAQKLLGSHNFFSTKFNVKQTDVQCQVNQSGNWYIVRAADTPESPMVSIIESGGRYVAMVCHEIINGYDLWVAYPIYEGSVKLACGRGVSANDGTTWDVCRINGDYKLTRRDTRVNPDEAMFYINGGAICLEPQEGIEYEESHAMPYVEAGGGVRPDGSVKSSIHLVSFTDGEFRIHWSSNIKDPLVGWHYDNDDQCWKQDSTYTFIYNPTEIKY